MNLAAKTVNRTPRIPPTPEQIRAEQKARAERDSAAVKANLPAPAASTAIATPDSRDNVQRYLDEVAPSSIVGRMAKFSGKEGHFATNDDGEPIDENADFIALVDQTLVGYLRFNGEGAPPDRIMGLLFDGFEMPKLETLPDRDQSKWELGLNGQPSDPWQHHIYLVLQNVATQEMFTFVTSSRTGRAAVGNLISHYRRMLKSSASRDAYPIVRLKVGAKTHPDDRVGTYKIPVFAVVGQVQRSNIVAADSSPEADFQDRISF
jgi:hypothetical protein